MSTLTQENLFTCRFTIPKDDGLSHADIILPIILPSTETPGLSFNGISTLKSFNLAGDKLIYTIPLSLSFTTIVDGVLKATVNIARGVYTVSQLEALVCAAGTGIIKNVNIPGFLIASDTTKLLSIRFLASQDPYITKLLGLSSISTNMSGSFITYDLPLTGEFPAQYDFTSTNNALISFGFSTNPNQNVNDIESIPLTIINEDIFELNELSPYNDYSSSLIYNKFIGNIPQRTIYFMRIRIENIDDGVLINNVNTLNLMATFSDVFTTID
jgi:hypothetical protein